MRQILGLGEPCCGALFHSPECPACITSRSDPSPFPMHPTPH